MSRRVLIYILGIFLAITGAVATAAESPDAENEIPMYSPAQIERALLALREGADDRTVERSTALIEEAGKDAFPVLLKYLNSNFAASQKHFKSEIWDIDPQTQLLQGRRPVTIGELAFHFIQNAIEEDFPRQFKIFQVLSKANVAAWLAKNNFLSLFEMRALAASEALAKAEEQHRRDRSEHTIQAVRYMKSLVARYSLGS